MKRYDCLIFDADHTLIDFDADERRAFRAVFAVTGMAEAERERAVEDCWRFSADNWRELGLYEVHLPRIRAAYHDLYATHVRDIVRYMHTVYGLGEHRREAGALFTRVLSRPAHAVAGANGLLSSLRGRYRMCVATNGLKEMQRGRLAEIAPLFEEIFISEEMGCIKPDPRFFSQMLSRLNLGARDCLMVGDSLGSDVAGAASAGMDAVWFNRGGAPRPGGFAGRAEIASLGELPAVIERLEAARLI